MKWSPHGYQKRAVSKVLSNAAFGLLLDPGLGKTSIILAAFKLLKKRGVVSSMLVIAPLRVCYETWVDEVEQWDDFKDLKLVILHGGKKSKALQEKADIYCINPEGLNWLSRQRKWLWPDMLVVDESTRFKHGTTQRWKLLRELLGRFKRRYILTGSPAPNGLQDLWGQIYLLDFGESLGAYITHFRHRYMYAVDFGKFRKWLLRSGASEQIHKAISHLVLRLDAADYLDMPSKIDRAIRVRLPKKAAEAYAQLEREFVLQLEEGEVTAANAAVKTSKLRQAANGTIYLDDDGMSGKRISGRLHDAKLDALEDLVEELSGQPLLVAYEFTQDLEVIRQRLGDVPFIGGGVPPARVRAHREAWNRGELPVLAAHPASAGHGLNFQRGGNHVAWFGIIYDLELYDQFIRRIWRQGQQKRHVFVHHIVGRGTIDEVVLGVLRRKARTQGELLDALRKRWK